jgi:hypothetical protein
MESAVIGQSRRKRVTHVRTLLTLLSNEGGQPVLLPSPVVPLGRPLARYIVCPFPSASHQTVRASFNAYSFPFVHSDALRRVSCPVWLA